MGFMILKLNLEKLFALQKKQLILYALMKMKIFMIGLIILKNKILNWRLQ